ncbi:RHS repeat-associated core domain-containing protein [Pseudomonas sp. CCC3.1]|uniref:RHS repeat-associated core domain-containing protein n=1 Tax=Pseudomonas sp. CCC3.1 TaxID=3048607 RepID=UPI002AC9E32E|nr:RHS repeat-associated core domain-containing protein [Pseudomonas sp. CCC3.1]MEB0208026.1 RHS repeat-associated core domain-containing protein [Pseudomonas sp. CCC3.1]WPX36548.1 RHS repeat-associated core domain-containing protein [Pseudomonas sp. CCC3.1]
MSKTGKLLASTYQYDPLDRLASANTTQRFYNQSRIATEIEGERKSRFFEFDSQPLAVQQHGTAPGTTLLATDQQTSVLNGVSPDGRQQAQAYSAFGHHPADDAINGAGFNGERPEPVTGHYLLGQGYRAFNPVLMRFNSPDSWSPFGEGGINAYAYSTNPINETDPSGHIAIFRNISKFLSRFKSSRTKSAPRPTHTNNVINKPRRAAPAVLKNLQSEKLDREINRFKNVKDTGHDFGIKKITKPGDLDSLSTDLEYKFIFDGENGLFVAKNNWSKGTGYIPHSVLANEVGATHILSAGSFFRTEDVQGSLGVSLTNRSGHYKPSHESLFWAKKYLKFMGEKVHLVREF